MYTESNGGLWPDWHNVTDGRGFTLTRRSGHLHINLLQAVIAAVVKQRQAPVRQGQNMLAPQVGSFARRHGSRRNVGDPLNGLRLPLPAANRPELVGVSKASPAR